MKSFRRIVSAVVVVAALGLVGWLGYRLATAADTFTYRAEFTTPPASDDALRDWLAAQPRVGDASVRRDGPTVVVEFTMPARGGHPRPDPLGRAEQLGYGRLERYTLRVTSRW
jgi:hypothetical protein